MINSFFAVLSAAYIFGIFFLADSSAVNRFSAYNPMSLLHIPLYAVLTVFLVLALQTGQKYHSQRRYIIASLLALAIAGLDEFYQSFLPNREASFADVLLDALGICLGIFFSGGFFPCGGPASFGNARIGKADLYFAAGERFSPAVLPEEFLHFLLTPADFFL